jgi:hypothetical protein
LARAEAVASKKLVVDTKRSPVKNAAAKEQQRSPSRKSMSPSRREKPTPTVTFSSADQEEATPATLIDEKPAPMPLRGPENKSAATLVTLEGVWLSEEERADIMQAIRCV